VLSRVDVELPRLGRTHFGVDEFVENSYSNRSGWSACTVPTANTEPPMTESATDRPRLSMAPTSLSVYPPVWRGTRFPPRGPDSPIRFQRPISAPVKQIFRLWLGCGEGRRRRPARETQGRPAFPP
jgi:hypothetical protein